MASPRDRVHQALDAFLAEDGELLGNDVAERTIAQRLAAHLQAAFPGWHVDCEYNRDMDLVKRLMYAIEPNGHVSNRDVQPDIIVHRRKTTQNLVVIEIKKTTNPEADDKDLLKLEAFIDQLGYENACFLRLVAGPRGPGLAREVWMSAAGP